MTKLTLSVTPELDDVLEKMAVNRGMSKSQAIRRAVILMNYLDESANNRDILLRDHETGEVEKLLLETQMRTT